MSIMATRVMIALALLAAVVFSLTAVLSVMAGYLLRPAPPLVEHGVQVLTPRVVPGGEVLVRFDNERIRSCPALIYSFLVDAETGQAALRYAPEPGGYGDPGRRWVLVSRAVPGDMRPGRYCYRHMIQHVCEQQAALTVGLDACFEVVQPAEVMQP